MILILFSFDKIYAFMNENSFKNKKQLSKSSHVGFENKQINEDEKQAPKIRPGLIVYLPV